MTHSDDVWLAAISQCAEVGVDVEQIRPLTSWHDLAEQCFTRSELSALLWLAREEQQRAFFRGWTRKEAFLKAVGAGITDGLDQLEVSLDMPPQLLATSRSDFADVEDWSLFELAPAVGYVGALAVRRRNVKVKCSQLFLP